MVDGSIARFWEVDFLRGIAVILMIIYHFFFDLDYLRIHEIDVTDGLPLIVARTTVALFLLLVGLSVSLSHSRARILGQESRFFKQLAVRSAWIMTLALSITLVTYLAVGKGFIVFGVLHLIGLSLLLVYPFIGHHRLAFLFGLLFIMPGIYFNEISVDHPWLLWAGLAPEGFYSLDYVPLFPWFGVVLVGMALGDMLYPNYKRRIALPDISCNRLCNRLMRFFSILSRNSLAIYLVHQPLILILLLLFFPDILPHAFKLPLQP